MTVRVEGERIHLEGACLLEDAEKLLIALQSGASCIDCSATTRLHLAIVQLLIAFRPTVIAVSPDDFIREKILSRLGN